MLGYILNFIYLNLKMEASIEHFVMVSLSFFTLLIVSSFIYIISKRVKFPYTVLLFLVWLLLVLVSKISFLSWIADFKLTPEILFFVFLPILVFESAYNIKYKELLKNSKTIFTMAVIWLLISTFLIWVWLYYIFPLFGFEVPFIVTLLFGAIISATDPVAVLALFKSVWAPRRLSLIFEWESLFNDGTSLAVFLIILGILETLAKWEHFSLSHSLFEWWLSFLSMVLGGIMFWLFMWWLFSKLLEKIKNVEEAEITLTLTAAHTVFLLSEAFSMFTPIEISWIISTAIAGIVMWNYGRNKISPKVEEYMEKFWEYAAWLANSLVFLLMWLILYHLNVNFISFLPYVFITIVVVIIARWISVYLPLNILSKFKLEEEVPMTWQHLLAWGSLRWALALMMALMVPEELVVPGWDYTFSIREFLIVLVITWVMFTLIIKALTIAPLMTKLKINELHSLEKFEYYEWYILALLKMLENLDKIYSRWYITEDEYDELKKKYTKKLEWAFTWMEELLKNEKNSWDLINRAVSLHALGIEKQYLKELFMYNEIDEDNYTILLWKIKRQQDRLESWLSQFRWNNKSFDDKNIFEKFKEKSFEKESPINKYIRNRAKTIILKKTIKDLKSLWSIDFHFDSKYFDKIIKLYEELLNDSKIKLDRLLDEHKTTLMSLETKLSEKTLLRLEESIINELYEKEIITPKLYHKFIEDIDEEIYDDIQK